MTVPIKLPVGALSLKLDACASKEALEERIGGKGITAGTERQDGTWFVGSESGQKEPFSFPLHNQWATAGAIEK